MNDPLGLFDDDDNNDPLGLFGDDLFEEGSKKEASWGTAFKRALGSASSAADAAISLPAGALANYLGFEEQGDDVFRQLDERTKARTQWGNPEEETSLPQDVVSMVGTLPAQMLGMVGSPAMKGKAFVDNGESLTRAMVAAQLEAGVNAAGMGPMMAAKTFAGRAAIGAGSNVAMGAGADAATQLLAEQEATKKMFDPYDLRARLVEALSGGVLQGTMGERPVAPRRVEIDVTIPDKPTETFQSPVTPEQLNLFDEFEQRSPISPYQTEMASDMWRVDENGIPIRADLSMELQNLQQPLQRNLFGDELDANFPRDPHQALNDPGPVRFPNDPEGQIGLTQAIDNMPEGTRNRVDGKFAPGTTRQSALDRLRGELPASPDLEVARIDSEIAQWLRENDVSPASKGRAKSQRGGILVGKNNVEVVPTDTGFEARVNGKVVGKLDSNITPEQRALLNEDASVDIVKVNPEFRGKGVGSALYEAWAGVNEGRVVPSGKTSKDAWAVWKRNYPEQVEKFVQQEGMRILGGAPTSQVVGNITDPEIANRVRSFNTATRGQGGGFFVGEANKIENSLAKSDDGTFIPNNPDIGGAIAAAKKQGKDGKQWNYTQSGSTSVAMKTGSPIILAASRIVQNALKRADLAIRNHVFPAEQALKKLKGPELIKLGAIMKEEMFSNTRKSGEELLQTLSVKQLKAYKAMRDLFDKTLDVQNAARVAMGMEPITAKEAYMSSRWQGDWRQPVYEKVLDKNGNPVLDKKGKPELKLVWFLAAHSKLGLNLQIKAFNKLRPGYVIDPKKQKPIRTIKGGTDLQSAYSTMLDILGRDDPAVKKIQEAIDEQVSLEGRSALAQEKHFEEKHNIRGFAGDRPWLDKRKDAIDMFQQQIQYAKNAFKWSEMQKASADIKSIISDPELQEKQPNNIKYIREYFKNALGMGEHELVREVSSAIGHGLGVSPTLINAAVGNMKSFFITQKLVMSMGYMASNIVQASQVLPYLTDLRTQGIRGNPITALSMGVLGALPMAMAHYMGSAGMKYIDALPTQFLKDAFRYAEDNGVTARSVYDESPVDNQFNPAMKYVVNPAQKITNFSETLVRSAAFMTFAEFLDSSGKFKTKAEVFQKAEELTNMSMVDYRESERPMMFAKAGAAGNFLNTLQTFPMSFYNQYAYMLGKAAQGNVLPLATMLAVQYGVAGAMGIPGFDDADKLYKWMRDNMTGPETWNKMMKSPFFSDPKMWMIDNLGQGAVYGALSDNTGLGMTSRVAAPGAGAMLQSPAGPVTDIAKQVGNIASAAMDPTNTTKLAQAAMSVAPVGIQGLLEQAPFMKDITYVTREDGSKVFMKPSDLADRRGGYARTPEERAVRQWGIRSQKEVLSRDVAYATNSANQALSRKSSELIDKFYDATRRGDLKKAGELAALYTDLTGKSFEDSQVQRQIVEEFYTDIEKNLDKSNTPRQLMNAARMKKILENSK